VNCVNIRAGEHLISLEEPVVVRGMTSRAMLASLRQARVNPHRRWRPLVGGFWGSLVGLLFPEPPARGAVGGRRGRRLCARSAILGINDLVFLLSVGEPCPEGPMPALCLAWYVTATPIGGLEAPAPPSLPTRKLLRHQPFRPPNPDRETATRCVREGVAPEKKAVNRRGLRPG